MYMILTRLHSSGPFGPTNMCHEMAMFGFSFFVPVLASNVLTQDITE